MANPLITNPISMVKQYFMSPDTHLDKDTEHISKAEIKNLSSQVTNPLAQVFLEAMMDNNSKLYQIMNNMDTSDNSEELSITDLNLILANKDTNETVEQIIQTVNSNKDFIKASIKKDPLNIFYASDTIKDDKEIMMECIKILGSLLQFASDRLKKDKDLVITAIKQSGLVVMKYADKSLKDSQDFHKDAITALTGKYTNRDSVLMKPQEGASITNLSSGYSITQLCYEKKDDGTLKQSISIFNMQGKEYEFSAKGSVQIEGWNSHSGNFITVTETLGNTTNKFAVSFEPEQPLKLNKAEQKE